MDFKKEFRSSVPVDFSAIRFYEIPFAFFAEWLHLVLEISKIIQPGFQVEIPKKQLDWFRSPDQQVFDPESGTAYTLRTGSVVLKNGDHHISVVAQYGYEIIPGQYIVVKPKLTTGSLFSRNFMKTTAIDFEITLEEALKPAVEEVFYIFQ